MMSLLIVTAQQAHHDQQGANSELAKFSLASGSVTLNEPVMIKYLVSNNRPETLILDLGLDRKENFRMTLRLPDGSTQTQRVTSQKILALGGKIKIQPGQLYRQTLLANEWFDLTQAGKYNLLVQLTTPIRTASGEIVASNPTVSFDFEVLPKDISKLKATCEQLFNAVVGSQSYQDASDNTIALGYIKDPVAVPYLEQLMTGSKLVEQVAIEGLGRINTRESVEVLIRGLNMPNQELVASVKAALVRNEAESDNPALKQQIKDALR